MVDWHYYFEYREGFLYWKVNPSCKIKAGALAGSFSYRGYMKVSINKRRYYVHRIVWEMHNGPIPVGYEVDHIDRNPSNNLIQNLRLVTHRVNMRNQPPKTNSGCMGVSWYKAYNKWQVRIKVDGVTLFIGYFEKLSDAINARKEAESKYWGQ